MEKHATLNIELFNVDMEAAAAAQKAVLEEIFLVDAKITREPLVISPKVLTLEHKCSTEFLKPEKDEKHPSILCNFQVAAFNAKSPNKLIMKIEATFCSSFSIPDGYISLMQDAFAKDLINLRVYSDYLYKVNPISTAWPYWREFVQNMSTRMGFPALTVPMLETVPKKEPEKKAKQKVAKKESMQRNKLSA
jgi:hypothetical protein